MIISTRYWIFGIFLGVTLLGACNPVEQENPSTPLPEASPTAEIRTATVTYTPPPAAGNMSEPENTPTPTTIPTTVDISPNPDQAEVVDVNVSGASGGYSFSVTISSPDVGCSKYADWWEVISEEGELFYRRILLHSHVNEQPFTRSGGPVPIEADTVVLVRAHMNPGGYGSLAMKGSFKGGFEPVELSPDFAEELEAMPPLPQDCDF